MKERGCNKSYKNGYVLWYIVIMKTLVTISSMKLTNLLIYTLEQACELCFLIFAVRMNNDNKMDNPILTTAMQLIVIALYIQPPHVYKKLAKTAIIALI